MTAGALTSEQERLRRIGRKVRKRLAANPAVRRIEVDKVELWVVPRFFDPVECGRLMVQIDAVAQPIGRRSSPEEQAWPLLMLNSPAASYVNGVDLPVDGGFIAQRVTASAQALGA